MADMPTLEDKWCQKGPNLICSRYIGPITLAKKDGNMKSKKMNLNVWEPSSNIEFASLHLTHLGIGVCRPVLLVLGFREPVGLLPPMATLNPKKGFFNSHALRILTCGYNTGFMLAFEGGRGNNMISLHLIFGFVLHSHLNSDSRKSMILRIPLGNEFFGFSPQGPKFNQHFQALLECSTHDRCQSSLQSLEPNVTRHSL